MKILNFGDDRELWLEARLGKVTGSKLNGLINKRGTEKKKGFYELIAERVAIPATEERPMERGLRLEEEAMERFEKETKKKVDKSLVLWVDEENESIAISPDGFIGKTEAIEVKCLNSANHIEAWLTQEIPDEYYFQKLQYFIVNPKLKTLYFTFYDDRIPAKDFFYLIVNRSELEVEIERYRKEELELILEIEKITIELTF